MTKPDAADILDNPYSIVVAAILNKQEMYYFTCRVLDTFRI